MTQLESALVEVTAILDELRIPYMLIGGLAVSMWGEPRATLDIDLSLWVEPAEAELVAGMLCKRIRPQTQDPAAFLRQTKVLPAASSQGVRVDLVFAALPVEKEAIHRARPKQVNDITVMVASVEDLIWMKLISERERDIEDARRLLKRFKKSLDRNFLEPRLKELAEALARPDILMIFSQALR